MSKIEWLHMPGYKPEVWNPVTGCTKISPGCKNCYAIPMSRRLASIASTEDKYEGVTDGNNWTGKVITHYDELQKPRKWVKPRMIFVNSMSDLFHESVSLHFIRWVFKTMYNNPQHIYIILTKRVLRMQVIVSHLQESMQETFPSGIIPDIWLGVSVENQHQANERIPWLIQTPAKVRLISCEPLLSFIDIQDFLKEGNIHWVISGGESGNEARPMHPDWIRSLRDQCAATRTPFFFKQWGSWQCGSVGAQKNQRLVMTNGRYMPFIVNRNQSSYLNDWKDANPYPMTYVGKKTSGNTLDGKQYHNWPELIIETNKLTL